MVHLIDVSGFIYRAFYGLPSLIHAGQEVGALYGFCSAMQKITSTFPKSMFIAALDCGKHTFRNEIYAQYKATRKVKLFPGINHLINSPTDQESINIPILIFPRALLTVLQNENPCLSEIIINVKPINSHKSGILLF